MKTIPLNQFTIDDIKDSVTHRSCFCVSNEGGELFQHPGTEDGIPQNSFLMDIQSANVLRLIYDALNPKNQASFNSVLQNEYKFARLIDGMWKFVS